MGIEPKIISESEPISEVTKITQPVGVKNVALAAINPATEDTLAAQLNITLSALRDAICATGASAKTLGDVVTAVGLLEVISSEITKWGGATLTSRDISLDLKALTDVSITGLLKSIGDIGAGSNLVTIAAAIETAVELIDNFISGARGLVTEDNSASILAGTGAVADAIVAAGASGSVSAKLRRATQGLEDLKTLIVLAAGTALIGKVGIDQTTPGTTNAVVEASAAAIKTAVETLPPATTPVIYNVTMTDANTEYSQALPANTKKFLIHTQDGTAFRIAFETGKVATPTAPYFTILANDAYYEDKIKATPTLYFGCAGAGKVVEIISWS